MIVQPSSSIVKSVIWISVAAVYFPVSAPNCHLSLVLASVVQGDAVNCNISVAETDFLFEASAKHALMH